MNILSPYNVCIRTHDIMSVGPVTHTQIFTFVLPIDAIWNFTTPATLRQSSHVTVIVPLMVES